MPKIKKKVKKVKVPNPFSTVPFEKLPSTKAWKLTSQLVRLKSKGICYTCKKWFPFEKLVAGHFREKRGGAATYFDLDNLRAQCQWYCNRMRHGAKDIYANELIKEKGAEIIETLIRRGSKAKVWLKTELEKITEERQKDIEAL